MKIETTGHTPGPWSMSEPNDIADISISGGFVQAKHGGESGDLIAKISCGVHPRQAANARLIAAAPALLAACERMNAAIFEDLKAGYEPSQEATDANLMLRAAIAAANGA